MSYLVQQIIVVAIVLACAGHLAWLSWRVLRGGKAGCASCSSCSKSPSQNGTQVVTLDRLRESAQRS